MAMESTGISKMAIDDFPNVKAPCYRLCRFIWGSSQPRLMKMMKEISINARYAFFHHGFLQRVKISQLNGFEVCLRSLTFEFFELCRHCSHKPELLHDASDDLLLTCAIDYFLEYMSIYCICV